MIHFDLPNRLIAQKPASPRDNAKLLVYNRATKTISDTIFRNLNDYLPQDSTIVLNNSKVEHCRWIFENGKVEIFVLSKISTNIIKAMVRPGKKFKLGQTIILEDMFEFEITDIDSDGLRTLKMNMSHGSKKLNDFEHVPLPPYIKQDDSLVDEYQTVFAKPEGSKAAPTAGLHFTPELLEALRKNHKIAEVTLHVGLGTFAPLTSKQLASGKLHSEYYEVSNRNIELLRNARHITAVGTTTTRTLESMPDFKDENLSGWTDILIKPGFQFKHVDALITNFHLPGTSLLLLVEAFLESESELQRIYDHAIKHDYRFYSFGDAMLVI